MATCERKETISSHATKKSSGPRSGLLLLESRYALQSKWLKPRNHEANRPRGYGRVFRVGGAALPSGAAGEAGGGGRGGGAARGGGGRGATRREGTASTPPCRRGRPTGSARKPSSCPETTTATRSGRTRCEKSSSASLRPCTRFRLTKPTSTSPARSGFTGRHGRPLRK